MLVISRLDICSSRSTNFTIFYQKLTKPSASLRYDTTAGMNKFENCKLDSITLLSSSWLVENLIKWPPPMERPCDVYKWFEMAPIGGGNIRIYISFCKLIEVEWAPKFWAWTESKPSSSPNWTEPELLEFNLGWAQTKQIYPRKKHWVQTWFKMKRS